MRRGSIVLVVTACGLIVASPVSARTERGWHVVARASAKGDHVPIAMIDKEIRGAFAARLRVSVRARVYGATNCISFSTAALKTRRFEFNASRGVHALPVPLRGALCTFIVHTAIPRGSIKVALEVLK